MGSKKRIKKSFHPIIFFCIVLIVNAVSFEDSVLKGSQAAAQSTIQTPQLKWQNAGCYNSWCETGWYASPAVADLDGDGQPEVIASAYSIVALNGSNGELLWRIKSGHDRSDGLSADNVGRTWPGIVVADVDNDGALEIVTAHGGGWVSVYNTDGYFDNNGWPWRNPSGNEFRSLSVEDLDGDGDLEIIVGRAQLERTNVWVLEHTGRVRNGWPKLGNGEGSAAGLYNDNIGTGDLDGDGLPEVIVPSDTITIAAYNADGQHLPTNSMYHGHSGHDMDFWAEVPAYVDLEYETRGWGPCYQAYTIRANFADGPANVVDVNGDGINEVVTVGDVHNCNTSPYTDQFNGPFIFNADRSRFNEDGFDWQVVPQNTGAPLIQNYNIIESCQPNPVTADLDGDGQLEIIYPSYDGRMHAFWLDQTEHHSWPYAISQSGGVHRFASEPAVIDFNRDGYAEVVFTTWVEKGSNRTGQLIILNYRGQVLQSVSLPMAYGSPDWNGALPAPTVANIDGDEDLELVINTAHSGFVAYDLPGTENARILWGTGRGSYRRSGYPGELEPIVIGPDLNIAWEQLTISGPDKNGQYKLNGRTLVTNIGNRATDQCTLGVNYPENGPMVLSKAKTVKRLKPSQSTFVKFRVKGVNLVTDAASTMTASVDMENSIIETNETNNLALKQLQGIDLTGQWTDVTVIGPKRNGYTVKGKYTIGSDIPSAAFLSQVYLSTDSTIDDGDRAILKKPKKIRKIRGGKSVKGAFNFQIDHHPSGEYLILKIDIEDSVSETSEGNNEIVYAIP